MQKIVLALQHATRLVQRIRDSHSYSSLHHDADQLMVRVELAAESSIRIHEELKEYKLANQLKCSDDCKLQGCPSFERCAYHWGDVAAELNM